VRSRYRGRIYLGPFNTAAATGGTGATPSRPAAGFTTVLGVFVDALQAETGGDPAIVWSMWSPTDSEYRFINLATYDDAWDTMRARGAEPVARTELGT
jgi:hypothetical protein